MDETHAHIPGPEGEPICVPTPGQSLGHPEPRWARVRVDDDGYLYVPPVVVGVDPLGAVLSFLDSVNLEEFEDEIAGHPESIGKACIEILRERARAAG